MHLFFWISLSSLRDKSSDTFVSIREMDWPRYLQWKDTGRMGGEMQKGTQTISLLKVKGVQWRINNWVVLDNYGATICNEFFFPRRKDAKGTRFSTNNAVVFNGGWKWGPEGPFVACSVEQPTPPFCFFPLKKMQHLKPHLKWIGEGVVLYLPAEVGGKWFVSICNRGTLPCHVIAVTICM